MGCVSGLLRHRRGAWRVRVENYQVPSSSRSSRQISDAFGTRCAIELLERESSFVI